MNNRKAIFDKISSILAVIRYDIEQHQAINDLSLNIHGENFFRDIFNHIDNANYTNTNELTDNAPYIDLVDLNNRKVIQITTNRTSSKIKHSLQALKQYQGYSIEIFYLLEKSKPQQNTLKALSDEFSVDVTNLFKDSSDLTKRIYSLEESRLKTLYETYFKTLEQTTYTTNITLNLVCNFLVKNAKATASDYDDPFHITGFSRKIELNKLNPRIAAHLTLALDHTPIIDDMPDALTPSELKQLVVEKLYRNILIKQLRGLYTKDALIKSTINELHLKAIENNISFDRLVGKLQQTLAQIIEVNDFNSVNIPWIIVAYYFEICLIGISES